MPKDCETLDLFGLFPHLRNTAIELNWFPGDRWHSGPSDRLEFKSCLRNCVTRQVT